MKIRITQFNLVSDSGGETCSFVLKELLLQFVISLIPVFSFQLWHYKQRKENHIRVFITAASAIAMVACMAVSTDFNGYELNFRFVPFILGSLYGGVYGALILDLLYIILRVPALDTDAEKMVFVFFMFVHVLLFCSLPSDSARSPCIESGS